MPNDGEEYRAFRTVRKGPVQGCANGATTAPVDSEVACRGALRLAPVAGTVLCLADRVSVEDLGFWAASALTPTAWSHGPVVRGRLSPGRAYRERSTGDDGHPFRPIPSSRGGHSFPERGGGDPGVGAGLGPQLAEDGFDVVVDGPHGDHEAVGDLAVLQALVHQRQHLQLTGSEPVLVLEGSRTGAARQRHHSAFAQSSGQHRRRRAGPEHQQLLQRQPQPRLVVGVG